MSLMGKSNRRLLVYRDMPKVSIGKSVDIILTPQFYTLLIEDLDIKFAYQAKQIAPSLFDDYIEDIDGYQFIVYRVDKLWHFIAFNIDEVTSFLEERGLKKYQISKVYFTQELSPLLKDRPLEVGDNYALIDIDGVVTFIPKKLLDRDIEFVDINLQNISLRHGVSIGSSYSLISFKHTVILSILLLSFGVIYLLEAYRLKGSILKEQERFEALLDKNPKLSSKRIRDSILEKYEPIDIVERKKRDALSAISKVLSNSVYLKSLSLDNRKILAIIGSDSARDIRVISNNRNLKEFKIEREPNSIRVEREF